jgi:hypothetical protein
MIRRAAVFFVILAVGFSSGFSMSGTGTTAQDATKTPIPYQATRTALAATRTVFEATATAESGRMTLTPTLEPTESAQMREAITSVFYATVTAVAVAKTEAAKAETTTPTQQPTKTPTPIGTVRPNDLIPEEACGDDWLDWLEERRGEFDDEFRDINNRYGDDASRISIATRQFIYDIRSSDPPAALLGYALAYAWSYERGVEQWEASGIGEWIDPPTPEEERARAEDAAQLFAAFVSMCSSTYEFNPGSLRDGSPAPTSTPYPKKRYHLREDACSDDWWELHVDRTDRMLGSSSTQGGGEDPTHLIVAFREAARLERLSNPPAAWMGYAILSAQFYERTALSWERWAHGQYDQFDVAEQNQMIEDLERLIAAYDTICGTDTESSGQIA